VASFRIRIVIWPLFIPFITYHKTLDSSPRLLSVQIVLTPGLYAGSEIYAGPCFYQSISKSLIFAADTLAYGSYFIRLSLLGITCFRKILYCYNYGISADKHGWIYCLLRIIDVIISAFPFYARQLNTRRFSPACDWDPSCNQDQASISTNSLILGLYPEPSINVGPGLCPKFNSIYLLSDNMHSPTKLFCDLT